MTSKFQMSLLAILLAAMPTPSFATDDHDQRDDDRRPCVMNDRGDCEDQNQDKDQDHDRDRDDRDYSDDRDRNDRGDQDQDQEDCRWRVKVYIEKGATGKGPYAYGRNPLVIKRGTCVTWINKDDYKHTATSDRRIWKSGILHEGDTFTRKFKHAGWFPYHCAIHGARSMSGTIKVVNGEM